MPRGPIVRAVSVVGLELCSVFEKTVTRDPCEGYVRGIPRLELKR